MLALMFVVYGAAGVAGVVDGACCKLAHSTINGIEVLPACAFMVALLMQLACALALVSWCCSSASLRYCAGVDGAAHQPAGALMVVLPMVHAHAAGWCS